MQTLYDTMSMIYVTDVKPLQLFVYHVYMHGKNNIQYKIYNI